MRLQTQNVARHRRIAKLPNAALAVLVAAPTTALFQTILAGRVADAAFIDLTYKSGHCIYDS